MVHTPCVKAEVSIKSSIPWSLKQCWKVRGLARVYTCIKTSSGDHTIVLCIRHWDLFIWFSKLGDIMHTKTLPKSNLKHFMPFQTLVNHRTYISATVVRYVYATKGYWKEQMEQLLNLNVFELLWIKKILIDHKTVRKLFVSIIPGQLLILFTVQYTVGFHKIRYSLFVRFWCHEIQISISF